MSIKSSIQYGRLKASSCGLPRPPVPGQYNCRDKACGACDTTRLAATGRVSAEGLTYTRPYWIQCIVVYKPQRYEHTGCVYYVTITSVSPCDKSSSMNNYLYIPPSTTREQNTAAHTHTNMRTRTQTSTHSVRIKNHNVNNTQLWNMYE